MLGLGNIPICGETLDNLMQRMLIPGRHGTITEGRGTTGTNPWTLEQLTAHVPRQKAIRVGRWEVPLLASFPQVTNLFNWSHQIANAHAFSNATTTEYFDDPTFGTAMRVNMTAGNAAYWYSQFIVALNQATTVSLYMRKTPGSSRTKATLVRAQDGPWAINNHTLTDEWVRVSCTETQNSTNQAVQIGFDNRSFTGADTQAGSFDVAFMQHEVGSLVNPPVPTSGTAVVQNADSLSWAFGQTMPNPWNLILLVSQYNSNDLHRALVGNVNAQPTELNLYLKPAGKVELTYGGAAPNAVNLSSPIVPGKISMLRLRFSDGNAFLSQSGNSSWGLGAYGSWTDMSSILIGQSFYQDAQGGCFVAPMALPGSMTTAEYNALETYFQEYV